MHPGWRRHEAQPHVLADEVLHVAALVVVVEFQEDPARHAIRELGEVVEGTKNPGTTGTWENLVWKCVESGTAAVQAEY